ncbi:hypothetical protein CCR97_18585 [Rhodoplanes elegans]|uniref:HTH araC/xylS-type domain-containing protein n=1 Tax=Rhodoplanes elegans TaxID=29408 RepID=A0A327KH87_9BRAD|nr:AraC family transcriptional regulator [Rhodoplanes elegans]MBK5960194.1 hypothetical protein [Rhodoplanes elegans]RAI38099.1 hypothetical protein CH338_13895 [Rhodoplanes elegans]
MGRRLHWLSSSSFDEVRHSIISKGPEIERLDLIENTFYYGTVSTLVFQGRDDGPLVQTIDHGAGVSFRLESTSTVRVLVPTAPLELVQAGQQTELQQDRAVFLPSDEFSGMARKGRFVVLRLQDAAVAEAMRTFETEENFLTSLSMAGGDQALPGLAQLTRHLQVMVAMADKEPGQILDSEQFWLAQEQLLTLRAAQILAARSRSDRRPKVSRNAETLRRTVDFIHAHSDGHIDLMALAEQAGLSLRSLQIMFRREFDSTIMQYIQRHRLTVARTLLEQARPDQTITSIARAAGFPHLSDFGRVYREMYGETPSETLRRYRPYGRPYR